METAAITRTNKRLAQARFVAQSDDAGLHNCLNGTKAGCNCTADTACTRKNNTCGIFILFTPDVSMNITVYRRITHGIL
jgi:hypothetical protein